MELLRLRLRFWKVRYFNMERLEPETGPETGPQDGPLACLDQAQARGACAKVKNTQKLSVCIKVILY